MKRKRSAALVWTGPQRDAAVAVLFSVFLFVSMHVWSELYAVGAAFVALALCIGRTPWRLARERFCVPVIGFLAFMVLYGAAAIYSPFGGSAVRDFRGGLVAFAVAALVLFRIERKHVRGILWGIAGICAVVSLLCTSLACEGPLYEAFCGVMGLFGQGTVYAGEIENTVGRVNGIYNDANVSASMLALGALISLYLVQTGKKWWERLLACVMVSASAVGLLLSVSRGAILCFGLALVVWLIAAGKGQRLRLFLLMVVAAGVCLVAAVLAIPAVVPGAVLPNLLAVGSGGLIFLLDWAVGERLARLLGEHRKWMFAATGVIVAGVVVFALAAFTITEPHVFREDYVFRSMKLAPGEYTVSLEGESGETCWASIYKQSDEETLLRTDTLLYYGLLKDASFTVPEGPGRVFFNISASSGDVLSGVTLSDGTRLPLDYKFLPEDIAVRIHLGLFSDSSYLLRIQFMKDAWQIFTWSPFIGHGLGSTDNLYPAVQVLHYTSRYVHNHILQIMADMGMLGLAAFLVFLGGGLWLLVRELRKSRDPLAAVLLACWVMMNLHSLMEINFSVQSYQCIAFFLLMLPAVLYGAPLTERAARQGGAGVCVLMWLYLTVFGGLLGLRQSVQRESNTLRATSMDQLMSALESYAKRDVFDPAAYQLEYVATAVQAENGEYDVKMTEYVQKIRNSGSYPACSGLLRYYYLPTGDFKGLFECSRECLLQRASYAEIWNGQAEFYRTEVLSVAGAERVNEVAEGVLAFQKLLEEVNQGRLEEVTLTEENQAFVDLVTSEVSQGLSGDVLYGHLTAGEKAIPSA